MIRKILYVFVLFAIISFVALPTYAEMAPIKITPNQLISTDDDEVQIGDWVEFSAVNDVYLNDKLFIAKDTPIIGIVDFVHPNGWLKDSAEVSFEVFFTKDVCNRKVEIHYPLKINDKVLLNNDMKKLIINDIVTFVRGSEIHLEPDMTTFTIFIKQ